MDYQKTVRHIVDGVLSLEEFFSKDHEPDHLGNNILFYCFSSKCSKIINYAQKYKPDLFLQTNNLGDTILKNLLNSNLSYFKNILYKNPSLFCVKNKCGNTILYNLFRNIGPVGKFVLQYALENHPHIFYEKNNKNKTFLYYLNTHDEDSITYILEFVQNNCQKLFYCDNFLEKYFENPMPILQFVYKFHPMVFTDNKKFLLFNQSNDEIFDFVLTKMPHILLETDVSLEKKSSLFHFTSGRQNTEKIFDYIFDKNPKIFKIYDHCNSFLSVVCWNKIDIETTKYILDFCLNNFPELFYTTVHNSVEDPFCNVLLSVSYSKSNENTEYLFDFVTTHFPETLRFRSPHLKFYSKYV